MKLNLFNKLTAATVCLTIIFTACKNESEIITTPRFIPPSNAEFKNQQESALSEITQIKTFKAEDGIVFTSAKGAIVTIEAGCLLSAGGSPANGDVTLSFIEMYDRGNMVLTNKPLMGKDESGNKLPLITAGQYNIKITQDGKELKSNCSFRVHVPAHLTGPIDYDMELWEGILDANGDLTWVNESLAAELLFSGSEVENPNDIENYYEIYWYAQFGWANLDRFYKNTAPKTDIEISVPKGFSHKNSAIYVSFEDEPNLLSQFYQDNHNSEVFRIGNIIPIGINAHIIFISTFNNAVVYTIKDIKVSENQKLTISENDLKTSSKEQVIDLINKLK